MLDALNEIGGARQAIEAFNLSTTEYLSAVNELAIKEKNYQLEVEDLLYRQQGPSAMHTLQISQEELSNFKQSVKIQSVVLKSHVVLI